MTLLDYQEILVEANRRIRELQCEATIHRKQITEYVEKIDGLVNEQDSLRKRLSLMRVEKETEKETMMHQIEGLQKLRDDITVELTMTERKANDYMGHIDQLVAEQEKIRMTCKTQVSMVKNQTEYDRVNMLKQVNELKKLKGDMADRFHSTVSKANDYRQQIDELLIEQEQLKLSHKMEISSMMNDKDMEIKSMTRQNNKLKKLRDDMLRDFELTESQSQKLLKEKEALKCELDEYKQEIKRFHSTEIKAKKYLQKIDALVEEQAEMKDMHKNEISKISNFKDLEIRNMVEQNEKMKRLRDELQKDFELTKYKAHNLMKEKEILERDLDGYKQEIKRFHSTEIKGKEYLLKIDNLMEEHEKKDAELSKVREQNEKMRILRDEMEKDFAFIESKSHLLMQEKKALLTELDGYKEQIKRHHFTERKAKAYLQHIEDLKVSHQNEISTISSQKDEELNKLIQQNEKIRDLRDEMKKEYENEQKSNALKRKRSDDASWKRRALNSEAESADLRIKYEREFRARRKLYNELQDLKGNIRVFARCRPLLQHEIKQNAVEIISFPDSESISLIDAKNKTFRFRFDKVFDKNADNKAVYAETAPYIQSVLDGYNVTIFAYGQTGSGKTFTMAAVNHNALNDLFVLQSKNEAVWLYETHVSMLEIYNEQIVDLLDAVPDDMSNEKECKIRCKELKKGKFEIYVDNLLKLPVNGLNDVLKLMERGATNRSVAETKMNTESSRSHLLTIVYIMATNKMSGLKMKGKLNLIDLAGSERTKKAMYEAFGIRMKEATNINKSLSALGDVIDSLCKKSKHVPYRNSKLTFILQDSLGQSAKTLMFINVSPADIHCQETLTSLRFAQRAKKVELGKAIATKTLFKKNKISSCT